MAWDVAEVALLGRAANTPGREAAGPAHHEIVGSPGCCFLPWAVLEQLICENPAARVRDCQELAEAASPAFLCTVRQH